MVPAYSWVSCVTNPICLRSGLYRILVDGASLKINGSAAGNIKSYEQLYKGGLPRSRRTYDGNGFTRPDIKGDTVNGIERGSPMTENHILETDTLQGTDFVGIFGTALDGFFHQRVEIIEGSIHFAVLKNDIPDFLQRHEDRGRDKLHGNKFACCQYMTEDEPEQDEQNGVFEQIECNTLCKRQGR